MATRKYAKQSGFVLPVILIMLVVFNIIGFVLINRFSGTGGKEFLSTQSNNQNYTSAMAGIGRAKYLLLRPDDPASAHKWEEGSTQTVTFTLNGTEFTVITEDIVSNSVGGLTGG